MDGWVDEGVNYVSTIVVSSEADAGFVMAILHQSRCRQRCVNHRGGAFGYRRKWIWSRGGP